MEANNETNELITVNITNHPSAKWPAKELEAAGRVIDIPFPEEDPMDGDAEIIEKANQIISTANSRLEEMGYSPRDAQYLVQGAARTQHCIVSILQCQGVKVVAATTERNSIDVTNPDGTVTKKVTFDFVRFADYPEPNLPFKTDII